MTWTNTLALHMLWTLETLTVDLDFLSVKMLCSTFAQTYCLEKILVENLGIQSCDTVKAVR